MVTLYWVKYIGDAWRALSNQFLDDVIVREPRVEGVCLFAERGLVGIDEITPGLRLVRITLEVTEADLEPYIHRLGSPWPSGCYVIPAAVLNGMPKQAALVSALELEQMRAERGEEWRAALARDASIDAITK